MSQYERTRKVIRLGESLVVSLPAEWARANGMKRRGTEAYYVTVDTAGDVMIVRPVPAAEEAEAAALT